MEEQGFVASAYRAGSGTLISRILGFIRDMVIAATFGAGSFADAFYVAFRIPNLLRNLLGEGALGTSFIPVFNEYMVRDEEEAWKIAGIVFSILSLILGCVVLLGITFAPLIVRVIAPGFAYDPEKFALTVSLARIMFPFLFVISLAALSTAVLNSKQSFFIPAAAPAMLSIGEVLSIFFIVPFMGGSIKGLAIGVVLGGLGQFIVQLPLLVKFWPKGKKYFKLLFSNPGLKKIGRLMLPAALGVGVYQIGIFVDTICASFLVQGSPSALYYANRLMQLPLAIFATSIATASLPRMSAFAAKKDMRGLLDTLSSGLKMMFFLIVPSAVGLIFLGKPIITVLFQRGKFDQFATDLTYWALLFYSMGLFSYAGVKVVASAFYSLQDTRTPFQISIIAILLNVNLNFILMRYMGIGGLALATAISSSVNLCFLFSALGKKIGGLGGLKLSGSLWRSGVIGTAVGFICYYFNLAEINVYIKVAAAIIVSLSAVFVLSSMLGMEEIKIIRSAIIKRNK